MTEEGKKNWYEEWSNARATLNEIGELEEGLSDLRMQGDSSVRDINRSKLNAHAYEGLPNELKGDGNAVANANVLSDDSQNYQVGLGLRREQLKGDADNAFYGHLDEFLEKVPLNKLESILLPRDEKAAEFVGSRVASGDKDLYKAFVEYKATEAAKDAFDRDGLKIVSPEQLEGLQRESAEEIANDAVNALPKHRDSTHRQLVRNAVVGNYRLLSPERVAEKAKDVFEKRASDAETEYNNMIVESGNDGRTAYDIAKDIIGGLARGSTQDYKIAESLIG